MSSRSLLAALAAAAVLTLLTQADAAAQTGKITGIVTDAQSGEPLAGAQIVLEGTGRGTLTQNNGRYFLINVQPGVYTVSAQLLGYATLRRQNVQVSIDVTREIDFEMPTEAVAVEGLLVEAERTPLIETNATGASDLLSLQDIASLPVTDLNEALALRSGFLEVPQNTDVISAADEQRGITALSIRGGRQGETLTMVDGVPINNFVFGGPAFSPTSYAVRQLDFIRGGFEPQYGNALSGIINIATREGGEQLEGALEYRTSLLAGELGSRPDELTGRHLFQGLLTGPVPGTGNRLRFAMAGREDRSADRVLEFDDDAFDPRFVDEFEFSAPNALDLWQGWRSFGYDDQRDLYGKLTFLATPTARLNLGVLDYQRQSQPFLFNWLIAQSDPAYLCTVLYDDAEMCEHAYGASTMGDLAQGSIRQDRSLYYARWDHTMGRTAYQATVSRFDQNRETCNFFQGVCLGGRFANLNFNENFIAGGITVDHPTDGTGPFFGGEDLRTYMGRVDIQAQVTDHHNLQGGLFYQQHELNYNELRDIGLSDVAIRPLEYQADPWEGALYIQDKLEYDFLTVKLGFRFEFGEAGGLFFVNPLDPTNGTTALDVCQNPGAWQNQTVHVFNEASGTVETQTLSADLAWTRDVCTADRALLTQAAVIASADDFGEAKQRRQFSPRLGVSFPVTESSSLFMNYGRYTQNPLFNNLYTATGIGTPAEGTAFGPILTGSGAARVLVGNPNLVIEETSSYEIGYLAEIADLYGLQVILFSKDQTGLTGVRTGGFSPEGGQVFDEGVTYGTSTPNYPILVNQDFTTGRGFEIGIRRRVDNHWGLDLNYQFSRTKTNAAPPERQLERENEGDAPSATEIVADIDQPHVFNGVFRFDVGEEAPWDNVVGSAVRDFAASVTLRAASGLPYTPTSPNANNVLGFAPDRRALNSGRAPATVRLDMQAQKNWSVRNMRYGVFLTVLNVTDRRNCVQVSPATGRCDAGAFDFLRRRVGNPVGDNASSTLLDLPQWIGQRRSILTGVRLSF